MSIALQDGILYLLHALETLKLSRRFHDIFLIDSFFIHLILERLTVSGEDQWHAIDPTVYERPSLKDHLCFIKETETSSNTKVVIMMELFVIE